MGIKKITIDVQVQPQNYELYIGSNLFSFLIEELKQKKLAARYAIITDSSVRPLHGQRLFDLFKKHGLDVMIFDFPAGENSKNRTTRDYLEDCLLTNNFSRDSCVIALGGGVVGDMAGFTAATYLRGIPYVQVPTTTISQADSSIGGKTAIDVPQGKNLIGAFHMPKIVLVDVDTLKTLDTRNYISGLIEMVKHGIIQDAGLFDFIDKNMDIILSRDSSNYSDVMIDLLFKNCKIKNDVVAQDPTETNLRKILNYGHTIGHAVEQLSCYNLLHGEAISIGIASEAYISYKLGYCSNHDFRKQVDLLKKMRLPVNIPAQMSVEQILSVMAYDKKARNKIPELVLIEKIGQYKVSENNRTSTKIPIESLTACLTDLKEQNLFT